MSREEGTDAASNPETPAATTTGHLSRRELMKGAAAGVAAGSALATTSAAAATTPVSGSLGASRFIRSVDVAVIGAGISGLYAAHLLSRKRGTSFAVIEARGRTGGRILNARIGVGNQVIEAGAEFIGAQDRLLRRLVINDLKLPIYDTFGDKQGQGSPLADFGRKPAALTDFSWPLVPEDIARETLAMVVTLDGLASTVDLNNPTKTQHAASWDVKTFQSWLEENIDSPTVRKVAALSCQGLFGGVPADASLLHFLYSIHAHGGVARTGGITGGAQQNRVVGGSQLITNKLANRIGGGEHHPAGIGTSHRSKRTQGPDHHRCRQGSSRSGDPGRSSHIRRRHRVHPCRRAAPGTAHAAHTDGVRSQGPRHLPQAVLARAHLEIRGHPRRLERHRGE